MNTKSHGRIPTNHLNKVYCIVKQFSLSSDYEKRLQSNKNQLHWLKFNSFEVNFLNTVRHKVIL